MPLPVIDATRGIGRSFCSSGLAERYVCGGPVSLRLVCRITNDTDAHCARHPDKSDSFHSIEGELATDGNHSDHYGNRGLSAIFTHRQFPGIRSPPAALLAIPPRDVDWVSRVDSIG